MILARRAKTRETPTAVIRRWASLDGRYAVDEIKSRFSFPRRYVAVQRLENGNEMIVSRHRKRAAAVKALGSFVTR